MSHEAVNPIHPSMEGKLDPVFVELYNEHVANTPTGPIDLGVLRKNYSRIYSYGTAPAPESAVISDVSFESFDGVAVTLRVYRPKVKSGADTADTTDTAPLPVHIDFHGGGWGLGDLDTESHVLKHYVHDTGVCVMDVDYRLVPDFPYPTGLLDCFSAVRYVHSHAKDLGVDPSRISIGGVSAGANIALAVSHLCRDVNIDLKLCVAGTPQVDDIEPYQTTKDSPYASCQECEFAPTLNWARLKWFDKLKWDSLSKDEDTKAQQLKDIGWFKSIITAPNFKNLPKTVIFTAGCDPMRDEGEAYAAKLVQNGNEVVFKRYPGVPHPFMHMDATLWQASDFIKRTGEEIGRALA